MNMLLRSLLKKLFNNFNCTKHKESHSFLSICQCLSYESKSLLLHLGTDELKSMKCFRTSLMKAFFSCTLIWIIYGESERLSFYLFTDWQFIFGRQRSSGVSALLTLLTLPNLLTKSHTLNSLVCLFTIQLSFWLLYFVLISLTVLFLWWYPF